jgi:hypothetical protein
MIAGSELKSHGCRGGGWSTRHILPWQILTNDDTKEWKIKKIIFLGIDELNPKLFRYISRL